MFPNHIHIEQTEALDMIVQLSLSSRNESYYYIKRKKNDIELPICDEAPLQVSPTRVVVEALQQQYQIKMKGATCSKYTNVNYLTPKTLHVKLNNSWL